MKLCSGNNHYTPAPERLVCLGPQGWLVDAGAVSGESLMQWIEGKHCASGIRIQKQSLCALLKWKLKENS